MKVMHHCGFPHSALFQNLHGDETNSLEVRITYTTVTKYIVIQFWESVQIIE